MLGVISRAQYNNRTMQLAPGDSLVIFTDGLSEAEGIEQQEVASATLEKKLATLHGASAEDLVQAIEDLVLTDVDTPVTDDVTLDDLAEIGEAVRSPRAEVGRII